MTPLGTFFRSRTGMYTLLAVFLVLCGFGITSAMLQANKGEQQTSKTVTAVKDAATPIEDSATDKNLTTVQGQSDGRVGLVDEPDAADNGNATSVNSRPSSPAVKTGKRIAYKFPPVRVHSTRHPGVPSGDGLLGGGEFGPPDLSSTTPLRRNGSHDVEEWFGSKKRILSVPKG